MVTTSYKSKGMEELITALAKSVGARKIVELGTQQGHSAILLAKSGASVTTYDLFEEIYSEPPFKETHADYEKAIKNTIKYNISIRRKNAVNVKPVKCDVLHIDICNHAGNVSDLVDKWYGKAKLILLEGGVLNKWQKKYKFKPYIPRYNHTIIKGENGYALTIIT